MEFKYELEQWHNGCIAHDREDYDTALRIFMTNLHKWHRHPENRRKWEDAFQHWSHIHCAPGSSTRGVSNFALGKWADAYQDFNSAHERLRGNPLINYHQLGLAYRLYECEVLFNRGICQIYMGNIGSGLTDLSYAQKTRMTREHDIIDQAIRDRGRGYSVYSIPPEVLYRPSRHKLEQLKQPWANDLLLGIDSEYTKSLGRKSNSILLPTSLAKQSNPAEEADFLFYTNALDDRAGPLSAAAKSPVVGTNKISYLSPEEAEYLQDSMHCHLLRTNHDASIVVKSEPDTVKRPGQDTVTSSTAKNSRKSWKVADSRTKIDTTAPMSSSNNKNNNNNNDGEHPPPVPVHGPSPVETSPTQRLPITGSVENNSYTRERLVDSGFVSSHEEKYVLGKQHWYDSNHYYKHSKPPPVPVAQHNQADYYDDFDTMSSYGNLDDELDKVYRSLATLTTEESSPRSPDVIVDTCPKTETYTNADPRLATGTKLKIKVHHDDTRILLVPSNITFDDLLIRVRHKFNIPRTIRLQYRDEDNDMVLMIDQDDLNMARRLARLRGNVADGVEKLEFWCIA